MKCRFPVAEIDGITIAVLLCETTHQHLGLLLHPAQAGAFQTHDPARQAYYVSWAFSKGSRQYWQCRLAYLGRDLHSLCFHDKRFKATWRDIYILSEPGPENRADPVHLLLYLASDAAPAPVPFRIPRWLVGILALLKLQLGSEEVIPPPPTSSWQAWTEFVDPVVGEGLCISIGLCAKSFEAIGGRPCRWAWARPRWIDNWYDYTWKSRNHDCDTDHIESWAEQRKDFGDSERTVRLSFTPCPYVDSGVTLVLNMELLGSVYDDLQLEANAFVAPGGLRPARFDSISGSSAPRTRLGPSRFVLTMGSTDDGSDYRTEDDDEDEEKGDHESSSSSTRSRSATDHHTAQSTHGGTTYYPETPRTDSPTEGSHHTGLEGENNTGRHRTRYKSGFRGSQPVVVENSSPAPLTQAEPGVRRSARKRRPPTRTDVSWSTSTKRKKRLGHSE